MLQCCEISDADRKFIFSVITQTLFSERQANCHIQMNVDTDESDANITNEDETSPIHMYKIIFYFSFLIYF